MVNKSFELCGLGMQMGADAPHCTTMFICMGWNSFPKGNCPFPWIFAGYQHFAAGELTASSFTWLCVPHRDQPSVHAVWCAKQRPCLRFQLIIKKLWGWCAESLTRIEQQQPGKTYLGAWPQAADTKVTIVVKTFELCFWNHAVAR